MAETTVPINSSGIGNDTLVTGVSGKVIKVLAIFFQCNIATTLTIRSGSSDITGPMSFVGSGGGMNLPYFGGTYLQTNSGDSLIFHFSGLTGQAGGFLIYDQVDV